MDAFDLLPAGYSYGRNCSMKRIALISLLILCAAPFASAQDWAKATLEKSSRHR